MMRLGVMLGAAVFAASLAAANTASAVSRCGDDLKDAGQITDVASDTVGTFTCDGGIGQPIAKAQLMGQPAQERPDGTFFLPALGVVVDFLDVTVSRDQATTATCQDIAAADRNAAATGMGHGGCKK